MTKASPLKALMVACGLATGLPAAAQDLSQSPVPGSHVVSTSIEQSMLSFTGIVPTGPQGGTGEALLCPWKVVNGQAVVLRDYAAYNETNIKNQTYKTIIALDDKVIGIRSTSRPLPSKNMAVDVMVWTQDGEIVGARHCDTFNVTTDSYSGCKETQPFGDFRIVGRIARDLTPWCDALLRRPYHNALDREHRHDKESLIDHATAAYSDPERTDTIINHMRAQINGVLDLTPTK